MATTLHTPILRRQFEFDIDTVNQKIIIISARKAVFTYDLRALRDCYDWLKANQQNNGWVLLGSINEQKTPKMNSLEEWARFSGNPIGGYYGQTPGKRGRFSSYIPSILEYFGFVDIAIKPGRIKAK